MMDSPDRHLAIRPLLDRLAQPHELHDGQWHGWRIQRIGGGWSNLLYRASNSTCDLAVKFTVRDARDRAGREYAALSALQSAGLTVAPQPCLLDRDSYRQPLVVQTWLEGQVHAEPPVSDEGWQALLQHLACIHSVTPGNTAVPLPQAVLNAYTVGDGRRLVQQQVACIPRAARPESLHTLVQRFERAELPAWADAPVALCRVDNNTLNFIRRPGQWASVDWENAGWGDPAFDIADWMTHAAYLDVSPDRWQWVVEAYSRLVDHVDVAPRIWVYRKILLVWWVARLARYLYEVPRDLDPRLAEWPPGRRADLQAKYERYLDLADSALSMPSCGLRSGDLFLTT
jgi:aminoglycoside phosphotransferase (APT) family kinase protein